MPQHLAGYASDDDNVSEGDMTPMFEVIVDKAPAPNVDLDGPFQMQITSLDYSSFVGAIGIGRIERGIAKKEYTECLEFPLMALGVMLRLFNYWGLMALERHEVSSANAGDIVGIVGIENISISDTICDSSKVQALPPLSVDEPTVSMAFRVNDSPFRWPRW